MARAEIGRWMVAGLSELLALVVVVSEREPDAMAEGGFGKIGIGGKINAAVAAVAEVSRI